MSDPLPEAALKARGRKSIHGIAVEEGVDEAIVTFERRRADLGRTSKWPFQG